jgi:1,2-phenylacetyl-CoA epoxidase catalytic subunit
VINRFFFFETNFLTTPAISSCDQAKEDKEKDNEMRAKFLKEINEKKEMITINNNN